MTGDLAEAVDRLRRYGLARDRVTDREPRIVTLTDDQALALLWALPKSLFDPSEGEA